MKFLKNLFLYFSAFIPLFVLLLAKLLIDIANNNLTFNMLNTINLILLLLLVALGVVGILWNTSCCKQKVQKIYVLDAQEITDKYFLQYFSLFVMFAIPLDIWYFSEFAVFLMIIVLIGIVYINCGLYYINPLLNILGYRFFDTTYKDENGATCSAKIFCKTEIVKNRHYKVKIKNNHFAFISKK